MELTEAELHQAPVSELLELQKLSLTPNSARRQIKGELTHRKDLTLEEFTLVHQYPECNIQRINVSELTGIVRPATPETKVIRLRCTTHAVLSQNTIVPKKVH